MSERIIVGYDGSGGARAAAAWALDEADRREAAVELVCADDLPYWGPAAGMTRYAAARPEGHDGRVAAVLERAVSAAAKTHPLVTVTAEVLRAHPSTALVDRSAGAELLVIGGRGHSVVAGLLGSVASAVSAHARCPVVVVRGETGAVGPVVAGVDGSAPSPRVLRFAAGQAAARKAPLRVIRTWPPVNRLWEASALVNRVVTARERKPFDALVATSREEFPELEITAEATVEHPAAALDEAGATAQLVVVGSRGRGAVRGLLLGSVSQHLLRHCPCTIAVIHGAR